MKAPLWARMTSMMVSVFLVILAAPTPADASGHEQIQGSGSSWAYNAISQWITDVTQQGLQVVFTPSGSAQGRRDYSVSTNDFGVSDIGYQGQGQGGEDDSTRPYAYLPIVGGATTFPYNLTVAGQQVQNLRLSGLTLAKIFTDQITNWDDPEVTADNNGRALPSIPIIPVVHSEGAGSTYQFTAWLSTEYPSLWQSFGQSSPVEFWPTGKGSQVPENGSDGVMNFVSSAAGAGSIGFDEYSYALGAGFPVAAIENTAGYFTMPDAYDAAVALTKADINTVPDPSIPGQDSTQCKNLGFKSAPCYLLEKLDGVYTYNDPRTYPLSSYSYEILPVAKSCSSQVQSNCETQMNTAKRQTLADFDTYSLCKGQIQMAAIGYSPLPVNLVSASFNQVQLLNQADPGVDISQLSVASCNNPTFIAGQPGLNYLAQIAPQPPACAKAGAGPCPGQYAHNGNPINGRPPAQTVSVKKPAAGSTGRGAGGSSPVAGAGSSPVSIAGSTVTSSGGAGLPGGSSQSSAGNAAPVDMTPAGVSTVLASDHPGGAGGLLLQILAAIVLLVVLAGPSIVRLARRSGANR